MNVIDIPRFDFERARSVDKASGDGMLSEDVLLSMLNASPDCIKLIDRDGTLVFMNHNGRCVMEIDDFDAIKGAAWCDLSGRKPVGP